MTRLSSIRPPLPLLSAAMALALFALSVSAVGRVPVASAQAPSCAVGTWTAEDLSAVFAAATTIQGFTVGNVEGRATLTVLPDGSHETTFDNVIIQALVMGLPVTATVTGAVRGVFTDLGDGTVLDATTGGSLAISASIFGQSLSLDQDVPPHDGVLTTLTCEGDRMSTSATVSETTITQQWRRSG